MTDKKEKQTDSTADTEKKLIHGETENGFNSHADESAVNEGDTLQRQLLRKIFARPEFNVRDRLNEYDEDYTDFRSLGDIVPHDMKHIKELSENIQTLSEQQSKKSQPTNPDHDEALDNTRNGTSEPANESLEAYKVEATSLVSYSAGNRLLVIADTKQLKSLLPKISDDFLLSLALTDYQSSPVKDFFSAESSSNQLFDAESFTLSGYLGQFKITFIDRDQIAVDTQVPPVIDPFDMVLDLSSTAKITADIPPFGYFAPGNDSQQLDNSLQQLPEYLGEFDKPRFFDHKESICVHSSSGLDGCENCLTVCPTNAIHSEGHQIKIDPYLCQGCGTCASVCPSGAMTYAYPSVTDTLNRLRLMINVFYSKNDKPPVVLFYPAEINDLPTSEILKFGFSFPVEAVTSIGMEVWLSALAYGAGHVLLLEDDSIIDPLFRQQLLYTHEILSGLATNENEVRLVKKVELGRTIKGLPESKIHQAGSRARFMGLEDKRQIIRLAIEHLQEQSSHADNNINEVINLSDGAPFGEVLVDTTKCTLCMSCVTVCPASALSDGMDEPVLNFTESKCVQCGLCQTGCPEDAIQLKTRYLMDNKKTQSPRKLNEESVFSCIQCGTPFATKKMIDTILERLRDHPMFEGDKIRALQMCEDCRVGLILHEQQSDRFKTKSEN